MALGMLSSWSCDRPLIIGPDCGRPDASSWLASAPIDMAVESGSRAPERGVVLNPLGISSRSLFERFSILCKLKSSITVDQRLKQAELSKTLNET